MASSTIIPYKDHTTAVPFSLVSTSAEKTVYRVTGRSLGLPHEISVQRKIGGSGSKSNDHVIVRIARVEANAVTGIPATLLCSLDISIPRDQSVLTSTVQLEALGMLASLLDDSTAVAATTVNRSALIAGTDL